MPTGTYMGGWGTPGMGALDITTEKQLLVSYAAINGLSILGNGVLDGTARDSTNTPTNVCRSGLVLGILTSGGNYKQYSAAATDGTQKAVAILYVEALTQDFSGNNADRAVPVLLGGYVKASQLIGLDALARSQLNRQFIFDDDLGGKRSPLGSVPVAKTTSYTVVAADNGKIFSTTGASGSVTFTLPAIAAGLYFKFLNTVAQTMQVTSAEGTNMVMPGFTAAAGGTNAAFSTVGQKSGGVMQVSSPDGVNWYVETLSVNALTTS